MFHDAYGYFGAGDRRLAPAIRSFLSAVPPNGSTELCRIMNAHKSDKGNGWHNYTLFYDHLLRPIRDRVERVFEVGIGSNDPSMPFAMFNGAPGASLRGWRDFFPKAEIFGADLDRKALFSEDRIRTFYVDQTKPEAIAAMWAAADEGDTDPRLYDLIIDDGYHAYGPNSTLLTHSKHRLKPGGYYIVEDVLHDFENISRWLAFLPTLGMDAAIFRLPLPPFSDNTRDNCIVLLQAP